MQINNRRGKHLVLVAPDGADAMGCFYGLGTIGAVEAEGNRSQRRQLLRGVPDQLWPGRRRRSHPLEAGVGCSGTTG